MDKGVPQSIHFTAESPCGGVFFPLNPTLPFILDMDTSNIRSGAVLAKVMTDGETVVAYYRRTFNKAEHRYFVTRQKLLAFM